MNQTYESRYSTAEQFTDSGGKLVLAERVPIRYVQRDDNIVHVSGEGDTWANLAQLYYADLSDRAAGLWWVIADFQPQPVVDPTLALQLNREIIVPSPSMVATEILALEVEVFE